VPDFAAAAAIVAHHLYNLILSWLFVAQGQKSQIEIPRNLARFRTGKVVTTHSGIEAFQAIEDQTVNRIA